VVGWVGRGGEGSYKDYWFRILHSSYKIEDPGFRFYLDTCLSHVLKACEFSLEIWVPDPAFKIQYSGFRAQVLFRYMCLKHVELILNMNEYFITDINE